MNHPTPREFLISHLTAQLNISEDRLLQASNVFAAGLDSFGFLLLIGAMEEEFKIKFSRKELLDMGKGDLGSLSAAAERAISESSG
jgi:acyl carrier protein